MSTAASRSTRRGDAFFVAFTRAPDALWSGECSGRVRTGCRLSRLLYTVGWDRIAAAAADINEAIEAGSFEVGAQAGLPLHRFRLEDALAAHEAVESV